MEGKCPINHNAATAPIPPKPTEQCPVDHSALDKCPVDHSNAKSGVSPFNHWYNAPANDLVFDQSRQAGQRASLSTKREVSSIPKGDFTPDHQPKSAEKWVYPSEQQYFNALRKKGYTTTEAEVPVVLNIHNMVNEEGWSKVKRWEAYSGNTNPKLKRFMGKPTQLSPKARFQMLMFGYKPPFDRHDWIVERPNGEEVRYVIDFYPGNAGPFSTHLDVRPALDSVSAAVARMSFAFRERFLPFTLPKWSLVENPLFRAIHVDSSRSASKDGGRK